MSYQKEISGHDNQISIKNILTFFRGDDTKTNLIFGVPIGDAKMSKNVQFHPEVPVENITKSHIIVVV